MNIVNMNNEYCGYEYHGYKYRQYEYCGYEYHQYKYCGYEYRGYMYHGYEHRHMDMSIVDSSIVDTEWNSKMMRF